MPQLTRFRREQLEALHRTGHTQEEIAEILGCHQSTISRELKRNAALSRRRYAARTAQLRTDKRCQESYAARTRWSDQLDLRTHVESELKDGKSPEQIAGRLKREQQRAVISHQTIYAYIRRDKKLGGSLYLSLRYQGKKYKWRGFAKDRTKIPNRRDIGERPKIVEGKGRIGDWESDLVVSSRQGAGAAATFAERKTMLVRAVLVKDRSADEMLRASMEALGRLPRSLRRTMTHDNGKEIAKHEEITKALGVTVYCARPYHSCDRGLNEWMNRELRRFFPKGTDFSQVTQAALDAAVDWLNNCPRKTLGYRTPNEAYAEQLRIMRFTV